PDPQRNTIRDELAKGFVWSVQSLALSVDGSQQSTATVLFLGNALLLENHYDEAVPLLLAAQRTHPDDFGINYVLASALLRAAEEDESGEYRKGFATEAARYLTAASAIRPDSAAALISLAQASTYRGDPDGAIVAYRAALRLKPNEPDWQLSLGLTLLDRG